MVIHAYARTSKQDGGGRRRTPASPRNVKTERGRSHFSLSTHKTPSAASAERIQRWPRNWVSSWWCRYASGSRACAACYTFSPPRGSRRWPSRSGHRFDSGTRRSPRGFSVSRCHSHVCLPRRSPDPPVPWPSCSATTWSLNARSCHHYTPHSVYFPVYARSRHADAKYAARQRLWATSYVYHLDCRA